MQNRLTNSLPKMRFWNPKFKILKPVWTLCRVQVMMLVWMRKFVSRRLTNTSTRRTDCLRRSIAYPSSTTLVQRKRSSSTKHSSVRRSRKSIISKLTGRNFMRTSQTASRNRECFRYRMRNLRRLPRIYSSSHSMAPQKHSEEGFIHASMLRSLA